MTALETQLLQRLKVLPPERVAEVVDFVEFLAARVQRGAAAQRLTEAMARLDGLNLPPISDDEIEEAVQAARCARQDSSQVEARRRVFGTCASRLSVSCRT